MALGPGIVVAGTPVAFGASISALRRGPDRLLASIALILSGLELVLLVLLMVIMVVFLLVG